jgi:uncharacterized protein
MSTEVKSEVGQVVWHTLNSTDPEKAKSFYGDLLGWAVEATTIGEYEVPIITANGVGHGDVQKARDGVPSHWLAHVRVDSVDDAVRRAEAQGGQALTPPFDMPEVGRFGIIRDPQGAVLSTYTPDSEFPVGEGVFAWDELISDDVEASKRYYTSVVGWTTDEMDMGDFVYTIFKRREDDRGSAGLLPKQEGIQMPNAWLTYLVADDVDATVTKAEQLGGTVYQPGFDVEGVGRIAVLGDPTGAAFGLFKMAPES